jgi:hypothetical protein
MAQKFVSDEEFIRVWRACESPTLVAEQLAQSVRNVHARRKSIEARYNIDLSTNDQRVKQNRIVIPYQRVRVQANIVGTVVVFSDAHFYPGFDGPGYQALLCVIKQVKPVLVIANGDILDAATMHKFEPLGWQARPSIKQELDAVREAMSGIQKAARGAYLHRTVGNHDIRFDKKLASAVPEVQDVYGMKLKDHLPEWEESWSIFINENTMVKHRIYSGIHSGWNNVLKSGVSTVTGHTHMLEVKPYSDYNGRRYGVSTGMLAEPDSSAFFYTEDNPVNWCQGFAVLTFAEDGRLLPPELCEVIKGRAYFRNQVVGENNV